ncbi:MAG: hypothetical protein MI975_19660 [Cytophagales bacterium]|nr:hypothetical protein [Cytophagales bacterium]
MDSKELKELLELKKKYGNDHSNGVIDNLIQSLILAVIFGAFVMLLWNALLPDLFSFPRINYLQSVGLVVLARLIFGGISFRQGKHPNFRHRKRRWAKLDKLENIDEWKHYDKFWEEEGKQHFEDYKSRNIKDE